jgi:hypothetical protein
MINKMVILVFVCIFCLIITPAHSQDIKAKTEDGKTVILHPDGTWKYVTTEEPQFLSPSIKPQSSNKLIKGKRGTYGIWIDENKWRMSEVRFNPVAEFCFAHTAGEGYAMIIDEGIQMPLEQLKNIILENTKKAAPDVRITVEKKRVINNVEILYMQMEGTVQSIPFTYVGYYYTGEAGTIQIITYSAKDLIDEFESDFIDFLNGFEVYAASRREISFADGSTYAGNIVNGKMHGYGTYTWPSGDKYVGEFIDNRASGGWFYKSDGRKAWCQQDAHGIWIIKER